MIHKRCINDNYWKSVLIVITQRRPGYANIAVHTTWAFLVFMFVSMSCAAHY